MRARSRTAWGVGLALLGLLGQARAELPVDLVYGSHGDTVVLALDSGACWRRRDGQREGPEAIVPPEVRQRIRVALDAARSYRAHLHGASDLAVPPDGRPARLPAQGWTDLDTDDPALQPLVLDLLRVRAFLLSRARVPKQAQAEAPAPPALSTLTWVSGVWVTELDLARGRAVLRPHLLTTAQLPPDREHLWTAQGQAPVAIMDLSAETTARLARAWVRAARAPAQRPHEERDPEFDWVRCRCDGGTRRLLGQAEEGLEEADLRAPASAGLLQAVRGARARLLQAPQVRLSWIELAVAWEAEGDPLPWRARITRSGEVRTFHGAEQLPVRQLAPERLRDLQRAFAVARLALPFSSVGHQATSRDAWRESVAPWNSVGDTSSLGDPLFQRMGMEVLFEPDRQGRFGQALWRGDGDWEARSPFVRAVLAALRPQAPAAPAQEAGAAPDAAGEEPQRGLVDRLR